ncbi:MAG: hypothetical protein ACI865_002305 [Flavobacteriaceae bacterium]|jgi:hypothetical protein
MKQRLVAFYFLLFSSALFAQDSLSVSPDTIVPHSVKKAILLSAAVPGAGQIYNHRAMPKGHKKAFWKLPLIYGSMGASIYFLIQNQSQQKKYRQEYSDRQYLTYQNGQNFAGSEIYDDAAILTIYNQYLDWRDLSILAVGAFYFLQLADAGVEAHFVSFDISEDLSMSIRPVLMTGYTPGINLRLNFR